MISKVKLNGFILPTTMILMASSLAITLSYYNWLDAKMKELDFRIAVVKAKYNAESGIAEKVYPFIMNPEFIGDTTIVLDEGEGQLNENFKNYKAQMGYYSDYEMKILSASNIRTGKIPGIAQFGPSETDTVIRHSSIRAKADGWGRYMYFTKSEKAGGAPFVYGPPTANGFNFAQTQRRTVSFISNDIIDGVIQTNGDIIFSQFGNAPYCPDFSQATWLFTEGHTGAGSWGSCSGWGAYETEYHTLFRTTEDSEIDTGTTCTYEYPPDMTRTYRSARNSCPNCVIDATSALYATNGDGSKDTLIMTDINFTPQGAEINQFKYLMPPHLTTKLNDDNSDAFSCMPDLGVNDYLPARPYHLDGAEQYIDPCVWMENDEELYDLDKDNGFDQLGAFCKVDFDVSGQALDIDIQTCKPYVDSLRIYHAKYVNMSTMEDQLMHEQVSGSHGISGQFFDIEPINNWESTDFIPTSMSGNIIYVVGGPVRIKGEYSGRWTVITGGDFEQTASDQFDCSNPNYPCDYTTYQRHAWNAELNPEVPIDTVYNNIYIVDDLINSDSDDGDLSNFQRNEDGYGGSENIMGLISAANIVVASTRENGLGNGCSSTNPGPNTCNSNISNVKINAALMALQESFVVQYWQNTTTDEQLQFQTTYAPNYEIGGSTNTELSDYNDSSFPFSPSGNEEWWQTGGCFGQNGCGENTSAAACNADDLDCNWVTTQDNFHTTFGPPNFTASGLNATQSPRSSFLPPWGDGRGPRKQGNTATTDRRGRIELWGGVVQKYRGYVRRNPSSGYNNADIGYPVKDYHYDNNILHNEPPGWPSLLCEEGDREVSINILSASGGND